MSAKWRALALSTHPGPTVAVTAIAVLLATGIQLDLARTVLIGIAVLAGQASVGLSNDWIDAERDIAVGRADKPVARGDVAVETVRSAAWVALALALIVTVPLGPWVALAHSVFIASAWSYNLGLKNSIASVAPYIVSFGLLPSVVTLAREDPAVAASWAMAAGALLGVAAHFANVLPDLDDDAATGIRGLPHAIGPVVSGIVTFAALAAASALVAFGAASPTPVDLGGFVVTLAIAIAGWALVATRRPSRLLFRLIIAAALVNVALLALSGERMLGPLL